MKKVLSLILALCLLLTMSCAMAEDVIARDYERTETTATDPATGREVDLNNIYVAAVNKSMGSFWMDGANTEGTAWAERTDGVTWGYFPAATFDAAAQMSALSDALATDPDVLLISPTSGEAVNEALTSATEKGTRDGCGCFTERPSWSAKRYPSPVEPVEGYDIPPAATITASAKSSSPLRSRTPVVLRSSVPPFPAASVSAPDSFSVRISATSAWKRILPLFFLR